MKRLMVVVAIGAFFLVIIFSLHITGSSNRNCVPVKSLQRQGAADSLSAWMDRKFDDGSIHDKLPIKDGSGNGDYSVPFDLKGDKYGLEGIVDAQVVLDAQKNVVAIQLIDSHHRSIVIAKKPRAWYAWSSQALISVTSRVAVVCPMRD